jgi:hypothetical protein
MKYTEIELPKNVIYNTVSAITLLYTYAKKNAPEQLQAYQKGNCYVKVTCEGTLIYTIDLTHKQLFKMTQPYSGGQIWIPSGKLGNVLTIYEDIRSRWVDFYSYHNTWNQFQYPVFQNAIKTTIRKKAKKTGKATHEFQLPLETVSEKVEVSVPFKIPFPSTGNRIRLNAPHNNGVGWIGLRKNNMIDLRVEVDDYSVKDRHVAGTSPIPMTEENMKKFVFMNMALFNECDKRGKNPRSSKDLRQIANELFGKNK